MTDTTQPPTQRHPVPAPRYAHHVPADKRVSFPIALFHPYFLPPSLALSPSPSLPLYLSPSPSLSLSLFPSPAHRGRLVLLRWVGVGWVGGRITRTALCGPAHHTASLLSSPHTRTKLLHSTPHHTASPHTHTTPHHTAEHSGGRWPGQISKSQDRRDNALFHA